MEEVREILAAYVDQLTLLRSLVDGCTDVAKLSNEYRESRSHKERLRALKFANISATRRGANQVPRPYIFFDVTEEYEDTSERTYLPPCFYAKVSHGVEFPREQPSKWRVGLCQLWFEKPYCMPECATLLEFRLDVEVDNVPYDFAAKVLVVDEVAGQRQCIDELGESQILDW